MPINKTYSVRYHCDIENADIYAEQVDAVALPATDPLGHTTANLRDLVILKEITVIS